MKQFCICLLFFTSNLFAQKLTLSDWVGVFAKQNINILYSSDFIDETTLQKIIFLESETPESLGQSLSELRLKLIKIDDSNYVVSRSENNNISNNGLIVKLKNTENQQPIDSFRVSNQSLDTETNNGTVLLDNLSGSQIELNLSAKGFYPLSQIFEVPQGYKPLELSLEPLPLSIDKIVVTASQYRLSNTKPSQHRISREELENTPSVFHDPLASSSQLAGNTAFGISAKNNTRGGNENESLVVLDNHILRNPYHFENFYALFSSINQSIFDDVEFYSGVFPTDFGGRLSSVMNISTGDTTSTYTHEVASDLLNTHYTIRKNNSDYSKGFMASLRSGGMFISDNLFEDKFTHPESLDGYFKTTQQINDNWSSSQHLLVSRDEFNIRESGEDNSLEDATSVFSGQDFWMQWNYDNQENSYANFQVFAAKTHKKRIGLLNNENTIASIAENTNSKYFGLDYQQTINLNDSFSVNFGARLTSENADINSEKNINHFGEIPQLINLDRQFSSEFEFDKDGLSGSVFINARHSLNDQWIYDVGVRYEYLQWIKQKLYSPRFNISYFHDKDTTYRFALGRHQQSQYIDELLLEDPNPDYLEPSSADVMVLEFNKTLNKNLSLRAEAYYKKYSSTQPYYQNLFNGLHILPELFYDRIRITPDDSSATGLEVTLNGDYEKYNWNVSYTISDSDDEIDDRVIPKSWDQHSVLKFNLHTPINYKFLQNWALDIFASHTSGQATTLIEETPNGYEIAPRNESTYESSFRLDLKISKQVKTSKGLIKYSFDAINAFDWNNLCCTDYQLNDGVLTSKQKNLLPFIPNLSVSYQWE